MTMEPDTGTSETQKAKKPAGANLLAFD